MTSDGGAPGAGHEAPSARTWAVLAHLLPLLLLFVGPLLVWLAWRRRDEFVAHHARESLNFQITALGLLLVTALLAVAGPAALDAVPYVVAVAAVVVQVVAAVAAARGAWFRYPVSVRFVGAAA
ncbi:DUF4870 domain-containing protein [Cellulomonas sp. JZ18]|uniref:DUF4870 domain-containing protein n=1 Tax=Cellulomonas sp. JZ18 TaxID=2654191 RepID=UPI0012D40261|nr:DUF4870 domain-containing protein [Cellulomonas sp. JZ18]QGQ19012.1 DUF4870 domain-containing protein [Cellulomonas sp. JZ18]